MKRGTLRNFRSGPIQTQFAVRLTGFNWYSETNIDLFRAGNLQGLSEKTNDRKSDNPVFPVKPTYWIAALFGPFISAIMSTPSKYVE